MNLRTIRAKAKSYLKRRAGDKLSRLPEAIRQHGQSGLMPTDPVARAYVELSQAGIAAMDASIGGGAEHEAGCRQFEEAYGRWQRTLQEAEI